MEQIVLIVHLVLALSIIGLILLQQGKGADMGASFGAGASQTLFGSDGSGNVLTRATAWLAALFFATSFGLAMIATQKTRVSDDLDLVIPPSVQQPAREQAPTSDVPAVDEDVPTAVENGNSSSGDVPER
ncbi:preprotein translocase subunit SecG [Chromatocurvus halotolerans]|uniref:Protein-export membrane protein SecG n=1 Tax=Chromatocurvus halotolerans TaxID=1132028 RepID=A0A4R2KV95_9GAMM|nr:preprotein translocase subunit SecG [Chromatocurvus halotolerans]TCO75096.1 protein translocase subunit secG [Chromatocurvus halotolerans]